MAESSCGGTRNANRPSTTNMFGQASVAATAMTFWLAQSCSTPFVQKAHVETRLQLITDSDTITDVQISEVRPSLFDDADSPSWEGASRMLGKSATHRSRAASSSG